MPSNRPGSVFPSDGTRLKRLGSAAVNVLPWFGALVVFAQLMFFWSQWATPLAVSVDSSQFILTARRILAGSDLYLPWAEYGPDFMTPGGPAFPANRSPYLPFLSSSLVGLAAIDLSTWARVVWCVGWLAFWGYAATLAALAGRMTVRSVLSWGTVLMLVPGAWRALVIGNIDPLLWLTVGLALAAPRLRGTLLALGTMTKVYPAWPLLVAGIQEKRAVIIPAIVAATCYAAIAAAVMGPGRLLIELVAWTTNVPSVMSQGSFLFWNFSLSFLPLRILNATNAWEYVGGPLPQVARIYLTTAGIAAPALAAWLTRRKEPRLQYGCVMTVAVLFAPLGWATYLPFGLAPLAVLLNQRTSD